VNTPKLKQAIVEANGAGAYNPTKGVKPTFILIETFGTSYNSELFKSC